jgi:GGDEF domain-containing protein
MVDRTLRHACRSNEYTTLITLQASRDFVGSSSIDVDLQKFDEVAGAIAPAVRETDFFGALTDHHLALLVVDAGEATACRVVERIADRITCTHFWASLTFQIGVAVYPTDGNNMTTLVEHATLHPAVNLPRARI